MANPDWFQSYDGMPEPMPKKPKPKPKPKLKSPETTRIQPEQTRNSWSTQGGFGGGGGMNWGKVGR